MAFVFFSFFFIFVGARVVTCSVFWRTVCETHERRGSALVKKQNIGCAQDSNNCLNPCIFVILWFIPHHGWSNLSPVIITPFSSEYFPIQSQVASAGRALAPMP